VYQAEDKVQPKEEALLLGWGVLILLPVKSRRYDEPFWKDLPRARRVKEENLKELGL